MFDKDSESSLRRSGGGFEMAEDAMCAGRAIIENGLKTLLVALICRSAETRPGSLNHVTHFRFPLQPESKSTTQHAVTELHLCMD